VTAVGATRETFGARGLVAAITCALVRDAGRPRPADAPAPALVDDADAFFARDLDVVVEVLGGVEPARTLVARALERGTPVVTANKSLLAAHGASLRALAAGRGARLSALSRLDPAATAATLGLVPSRLRLRLAECLFSHLKSPIKCAKP